MIFPSFITSGTFLLTAFASAQTDTFDDRQSATALRSLQPQNYNFETIASQLCNDVTTESVEYDATFTNLWTVARHPYVFPVKSEHWSPIVFASHNDAYEMWSEGTKASKGVESIAETGSTSELRSELDSAQKTNTVLDFVQGPGQSAKLKEKTFVKGLKVDKNHPLVSAISMIAPSPDWFSGVSDLALFTSQDGWYRSIVVSVYAWDAGTEEGDRYQLSNSPTGPPHDDIAPFTAGSEEDALFVSKNSASGELQVLPVGKIKFELSAGTVCTTANILVRIRGSLKTRNCNWVARKPSKLCRKKVRNADGAFSGTRAKDFCPETCQ